MAKFSLKSLNYLHTMHTKYTVYIYSVCAELKEIVHICTCTYVHVRMYSIHIIVYGSVNKPMCVCVFHTSPDFSFFDRPRVPNFFFNILQEIRNAASNQMCVYLMKVCIMWLHACGMQGWLDCVNNSSSGVQGWTHCQQPTAFRDAL